MTSIEKARKIVEQNGECDGFMCGSSDDLCPCYVPGENVHHCHHGKEFKLKYVKKWLAEHEEKEIIGWPGNAEEMRQYIGRKVMYKDYWAFDWGGPLVLKSINGMDCCFVVGGGYRYIKVLPEEPKPAVKEYTIQEIADKLGVPVETIRIKDK